MLDMTGAGRQGIKKISAASCTQNSGEGRENKKTHSNGNKGDKTTAGEIHTKGVTGNN